MTIFRSLVLITLAAMTLSLAACGPNQPPDSGGGTASKLHHSN